MPSGSGDRLAEVQDAIDDDVLDSAREAGVDVDDVIESVADENDGYGPGTVARFATAELRRRVEAANAEELSGIIMGSRDRHGKNWPRRHSLVRSSGDHIEVSSWDGALPTDDGTKVPIPVGGAIVRLGCDYDEEYGSYEAKRLDGVTDLSSPETAEKVSQVATGPDDLSRDDEYEVVCVRGRVAFVNPQTIFEDGEPKNDGPVLMEDARGEAQPHFEVALNQEGQTRARGHIERQGNGRPHVDLPDIEMLLTDAMERFDNPSDQASFIQDALQGLDVILVGNVNSYDRSRDDGDVTNYVDIGLTALVAADPDDTDQATMDAAVEDAPESEPESEPDADDSDDADEGDESGDDAGSGDGRDIAEVRSDIEDYCDLTGTDIDSLTADGVREKMNLDDPEVVIQQALEGREASDDADDTDDQFAALLSGGTYNCPGDGCLFQAGSHAELFGHVDGTHSPDESAEEWIAERM